MKRSSAFHMNVYVPKNWPEQFLQICRHKLPSGKDAERKDPVPASHPLPNSLSSSRAFGQTPRVSVPGFQPNRRQSERDCATLSSPTWTEISLNATYSLKANTQNKAPHSGRSDITHSSGSNSWNSVSQQSISITPPIKNSSIFCFIA